MCPGEKRKLTVPPNMAYGHKGGRKLFVLFKVIFNRSKQIAEITILMEYR